MAEKKHIYAAIDLKSFYASVECVERGLDPLKTNLVVADRSRTEKTICLAVSPSLKAYGISGRARLFEVVQKVKEVNAGRKLNAPGGIFEGESYDDEVLKASPGLSVSYITAPPRMALYMKYSTDIYNIYLKYVAPEDIHRRGIYGSWQLSGSISDERTGINKKDDTGNLTDYGNHRSGRNWHEFIFV